MEPSNTVGSLLQGLGQQKMQAALSCSIHPGISPSSSVFTGHGDPTFHFSSLCEITQHSLHTIHLGVVKSIGEFLGRYALSFHFPPIHPWFVQTILTLRVFFPTLGICLRCWPMAGRPPVPALEAVSQWLKEEGPRNEWRKLSHAAFEAEGCRSRVLKGLFGLHEPGVNWGVALPPSFHVLPGGKALC